MEVLACGFLKGVLKFTNPRHSLDSLQFEVFYSSAHLIEL